MNPVTQQFLKDTGAEVPIICGPTMMVKLRSALFLFLLLLISCQQQISDYILSE